MLTRLWSPYFTLRIDGNDYHFGRDTSRPGLVTAYSDPDWTQQTHELGTDEYASFLLTSYGLAETGTSWRDLVGRFSRDDESDLALLDKPLASVAREPDTVGAAALLRLFGAYTQIEQIQARYASVRKEAEAIDAMAKGNYSNYIKLTKKSEWDQAAKDLTQAQIEATQLRRRADLDLFEDERRARNEQMLLRAALRPLIEQLDLLSGKLALVEATLAGKSRITTEDLEEFYTFFPEAEREKIETIEFYHHELSGILAEQLSEQRLIYQAQTEQLKTAIHAQQARIIALGESVQLDDETYNQSLELNTRITQLQEQIRAFNHNFNHNQELKKERQALKAQIEEAIPAELGKLADKINTQMRAVNDELYPDVHRKSPIFEFKADTKGVSYDFDHNGDTGPGARSKNLVVFDLAVLSLTPLPFLIHDSAIVKTIAYDPVVELLKVYAGTATLRSGANEPKQVFFSFDAATAYGTQAQEVVAAAQVIHLGGPEALYGFTWNIETINTSEEGDIT